MIGLKYQLIVEVCSIFSSKKNPKRNRKSIVAPLALFLLSSLLIYCQRLFRIKQDLICYISSETLWILRAINLNNHKHPISMWIREFFCSYKFFLDCVRFAIWIKLQNLKSPLLNLSEQFTYSWAINSSLTNLSSRNYPICFQSVDNISIVLWVNTNILNY